MTTCWYCSSELPDSSQYCHTCGHSQTDRSSSPLFGVVDPVTGIWNSKFINALVGQEANRAIRYHRPLSVLVVELDHAEHVNKELGQIQLEGLLREISERLGHAVRDTDTVAFLDADGPPHFAIVLPETNEQGATLAADKIRRGIAAHDFSTGGNWQRITVSCGAATIGVLPSGDDEAGLMNRREYTGNLLREAYHALEAGRSAGTNRTSVGAFRS
jgi:diguanylate cyclase (GGDEF)-like protein